MRSILTCAPFAPWTKLCNAGKKATELQGRMFPYFNWLHVFELPESSSTLSSL